MPTTWETQDHLIAVIKRELTGQRERRGRRSGGHPDEGYWCQYATDWTEVKFEWALTMTQREAEAVIEMLDTCEEPVEVEASENGGHLHAGART